MLCLVLKIKNNNNEPVELAISYVLCSFFCVFLLSENGGVVEMTVERLATIVQLPLQNNLGAHQVHQLSHKQEQNSQHLLCTFMHCCLHLVASPHLQYDTICEVQTLATSLWSLMMDYILGRNHMDSRSTTNSILY